MITKDSSAPSNWLEKIDLLCSVKLNFLAMLFSVCRLAGPIMRSLGISLVVANMRHLIMILLAGLLTAA